MKQFSQLERAVLCGNSTSNELVRHSAQQGNECIAPSHQHAEESEGRLESWKEIATYLRREVRTVQRWEKREGLPVHRHFHNKVGSIYAFKTEINEWRRSRSPNPCAMVSQGKDCRTINNVPVARGHIRNQTTLLYWADQAMWSGEKEDSLPAIIYVAPSLLTLAGELKSLCLGNLLAISASGKIRRVSDFAASSEKAQGNKR